MTFGVTVKYIKGSFFLFESSIMKNEKWKKDDYTKRRKMDFVPHIEILWL